MRTEDMYYNVQKRSEVMEMAYDAGAIYRMNGIVLINREIFDEYLERFHETKETSVFEEKGNKDALKYGCFLI